MDGPHYDPVAWGTMRTIISSGTLTLETMTLTLSCQDCASLALGRNKVLARHQMLRHSSKTLQNLDQALVARHGLFEKAVHYWVGIPRERLAYPLLAEE